MHSFPWHTPAATMDLAPAWSSRQSSLISSSPHGDRHILAIVSVDVLASRAGAAAAALPALFPATGHAESALTNSLPWASVPNDSKIASEMMVKTSNPASAHW